MDPRDCSRSRKGVNQTFESKQIIGYAYSGTKSCIFMENQCNSRALFLTSLYAHPKQN